MSKQFLFWFFFLLALIAAVIYSRGPLMAGRYSVPGLAVFLLVMVFIIGLTVFGSPIQ